MILKGYELLKEISEGNIKEGTKFKIIQNYGNYTYAKLYKTGKLLNLMNEEFENPLAANWLIDTECEIIEEPKEINIQDIEEIQEILKEGEEAKQAEEKQNEENNKIVGYIVAGIIGVIIIIFIIAIIFA